MDEDEWYSSYCPDPETTPLDDLRVMMGSLATVCTTLSDRESWSFDQNDKRFPIISKYRFSWDFFHRSMKRLSEFYIRDNSKYIQAVEDLLEAHPNVDQDKVRDILDQINNLVLGSAHIAMTGKPKAPRFPRSNIVSKMLTDSVSRFASEYMSLFNELAMHFEQADDIPFSKRRYTIDVVRTL